MGGISGSMRGGSGPQEGKGPAVDGGALRAGVRGVAVSTDRAPPRDRSAEAAAPGALPPRGGAVAVAAGLARFRPASMPRLPDRRAADGRLRMRIGADPLEERRRLPPRGRGAAGRRRPARRGPHARMGTGRGPHGPKPETACPSRQPPSRRRSLASLGRGGPDAPDRAATAGTLRRADGRPQVEPLREALVHRRQRAAARRGREVGGVVRYRIVTRMPGAKRLPGSVLQSSITTGRSAWERSDTGARVRGSRRSPRWRPSRPAAPSRSRRRCGSRRTMPRSWASVRC